VLRAGTYSLVARVRRRRARFGVPDAVRSARYSPPRGENPRRGGGALHRRPLLPAHASNPCCISPRAPRPLTSRAGRQAGGPARRAGSWPRPGPYKLVIAKLAARAHGEKSAANVHEAIEKTRTHLGRFSTRWASATWGEVTAKDLARPFRGHRPPWTRARSNCRGSGRRPVVAESSRFLSRAPQPRRDRALRAAA